MKLLRIEILIRSLAQKTRSQTKTPKPKPYSRAITKMKPIPIKAIAFLMTLASK